MRFEGWEKLLSDYIEEQARIPFEWGVSDCLLFASTATNIICGIDPAAQARGQYSDIRTAAEMSARFGVKTEDIFDVYFPRKKKAYAQRGDVVLKYKESGATFGIVHGGKVVFKAEGVGLVYEDLKSVDIVWNVE